MFIIRKFWFCFFQKYPKYIHVHQYAHVGVQWRPKIHQVGKHVTQTMGMCLPRTTWLVPKQIMHDHLTWFYCFKLIFLNLILSIISGKPETFILLYETTPGASVGWDPSRRGKISPGCTCCCSDGIRAYLFLVLWNGLPRPMGLLWLFFLCLDCRHSCRCSLSIVVSFSFSFSIFSFVVDVFVFCTDVHRWLRLLMLVHSLLAGVAAFFCKMLLHDGIRLRSVWSGCTRSGLMLAVVHAVVMLLVSFMRKAIWRCLLFLSEGEVSNSRVANDSSNLLSSRCGLRSLVRNPMLRIPTGMENLETTCLHVSSPLVLIPACLLLPLVLWWCWSCTAALLPSWSTLFLPVLLLLHP